MWLLWAGPRACLPCKLSFPGSQASLCRCAKPADVPIITYVMPSEESHHDGCERKEFELSCS